MLAHDVRRDSFPPPRRNIGPHNKTMDTHASKHQRRLQSCGQEQPSITPITVSDHNKGSQLYVAPKGNLEDSCGQPQVHPSSCRTSMAHSQSAKPHPYVTPPRFLKQQAASMGKPNPSLDYSTFPKQLRNPVTSTCGQRPDTNPFIVDSPSLTHQIPPPLEPMLDIKAALSAQGIHIGIQPSTSHLQPPTEPHPHIDQVRFNYRPLGATSGDHMNTLTTPSELPKRPPGLQSPAGRGVALPVASIHVSLPPPSKAKKLIRKTQSSGPEFSVTDLELVTVKPATPEPVISPISSNSVKLPFVRGGPSSPKSSLGESTTPTPLNSATDTRSSSTSGMDEMCRNWFAGFCTRKQCPRAHERIPTNLTCYRWLRGECTRLWCPFVHERQSSDTSVKNQPPVLNGDSRDVVQVADGPVKDQPLIRHGNTRDGMQVPDRPVKDKPPVRTRNTRDSVQVPASPAKDQLSVRNSNICTQVPDRPVSDQPPSRNGKTSEDVQVADGFVKSQASVRNGGARGAIDQDLTRPLSSSTPSSAQCSMTQVPPSETKSRGSGRHSQAASINTTQKSTEHSTSSNPNGRQPKEVCPDWLRGRCQRPACRYPHERPNDNISQTNAPSPVRNTRADDAPASGNSLSRHPQSNLPPPTTRRNEDLVIPVTIADHITVKLRDGFDIQDVTTGFETRWVHLGDVSPHVKESQLRSLLEAYRVDELCIPDGKGAKRLTVKVQFSTAAQALEASVALHGRQFQGRRLTAKLSLNTTARGTTVLRDTAVRITWNAPQRVGYAGYVTLSEAKAAIAAATGFVMKDNVLSAALYEGLPAVGVYSVMFSHLPPDAERKDLEQFGNAESILLERPNYDSLDSARHAVLRILHSCGNLSNFDLVLPIWNGTVLVWATFETHADASNARDHLDSQRPRAIGGKTYISARHVQSLNFSLPSSKFKMLEGDIARLRWTWRTRFNHDVTLVDHLASPDGPVHIRISAENLSNLGIAKAEFEQLQRGEVVTLQRKPIWDRFFSHPSGYLFLRELESRYPGIGLRTRMGKILLLGPIEQRQLARRDIMMRFQELQARRWWRIPLSGRVVGPFVGTHLVTLQKTLGPENCYVHHISDQRNLVVRGNEQAYRIACEAVEKVQSRFTDTSIPSPCSVCPVCFTEASVPTILTCGHTWCTSCLESYIVSAVENKAFPLTCLGADASCTERISITLAKKILSGEDFASLCDASFWSYVHARTDQFHHCPTPDCAQVYRTVPGSVILQCPSCLARICSGCNTEAHDGFTCEERDQAEDKLYHEWAATHDVKNCPGCKTPIERSEGCNHMTCVKCQTHICWECLSTFPKGDGIYDHMREQHGSIGLEFL